MEEYKQRKNHDQEVRGVECIPFNEVLEKIKSGEIYIGLQIAVITRYFIQNELMNLKCGIITK